MRYIPFFIVGLLLLPSFRCSRYIEDRDSFPGWRGELPEPGRPHADNLNASHRREPNADDVPDLSGQMVRLMSLISCRKALFLRPSESLWQICKFDLLVDVNRGGPSEPLVFLGKSGMGRGGGDSELETTGIPVERFPYG